MLCRQVKLDEKFGSATSVTRNIGALTPRLQVMRMWSYDLWGFVACSAQRIRHGKGDAERQQRTKAAAKFCAGRHDIMKPP